jgi:hypothetical protein
MELDVMALDLLPSEVTGLQRCDPWRTCGVSCASTCSGSDTCWLTD